MIKVLNDYGVLHELVMSYDAEMLPCRAGETVRVSMPVHAWLNDEDIVDSEMVVVISNGEVVIKPESQEHWETYEGFIDDVLHHLHVFGYVEVVK